MTLYDTTLASIEQLFGAEGTFRDGQWEAIEALVAQRQRVLVVQRTGWGKSLVYFLATKLLRDQGGGTTLLISPLLSLMRNQLQAAQKLGLNAQTLNSTSGDEGRLRIEMALRNNQVDLLLISPEWLWNDHFRASVWPYLRGRIGLLVVDEVHCISDWGHDFRPNYRRIKLILDEIPPGTPVLGTTATANDRVVQDVADIFGDPLTILRGVLTRASLRLLVNPEVLSQADRLALLLQYMRTLPGSGIIYCTTTHDCQQVADWLQSEGINAKPYYANVFEKTGEDREQLEDDLIHNRVKALVASVALGMGFDKPDLRFVIHFQMPGSIVGYYQQIGRAGRGIDDAFVMLLHGSEDRKIQEYFFKTAFPTRDQVNAVLSTIGGAPSGIAFNALLSKVNTTYSMLKKALLHLELEGIIEEGKRGFTLSDQGAQPDYERWERLTAQRFHELDQMDAYLNHKGCLMRFIAGALDDPSAQVDCGRCQNCDPGADARRLTPDPDIAAQARQFLFKSQYITIEPRKQWPSNLDAIRGKLKQPNETGLALTIYHDERWGRAVRLGKFVHGEFSDELVRASADVLRRYWATIPTPPRWITAVPSLRYPTLVPDFAESLAAALGLPYYPVIRKVRETLEQRKVQNSPQQVQNLWDAFAVPGKVSAQPVLLVDDMTDSVWTLTVIGHLLRVSGSAEVHPFVLAKFGFDA